MFKNKILLITGGTGSFGNAVLNRFLDTDIGEIRIFSRDEKNKGFAKRRRQPDSGRHQLQIAVLLFGLDSDGGRMRVQGDAVCQRGWPGGFRLEPQTVREGAQPGGSDYTAGTGFFGGAAGNGSL